MEVLDRDGMDNRHSSFRWLRDHFDDPRTEPPSVQNCWVWAVKRWCQKGGWLVITLSPRVAVVRCMWAPQGKGGPLWHFDPLRPRKGLAGLWHAYLHEGRPRDMRKHRGDEEQ